MEWYRKHRLWLWLAVFLAIVAIWIERWQHYNEHSQDQHIRAAAQKYGVDPSLIKAVVWRESRFNPRVRGKVGEIGLMQVGKLAAEEWARAEGFSYFEHTELFNPAKNVLAGTWYLRRLLRRYGHTDYAAPYALADYNAGRNNVLRWTRGAGATNSAAFLQQMDFRGTRRYVEAILKRQPRYQREFEALQSTAKPQSTQRTE